MRRQVLWNFAAQIAGIALPPLVLIVLARLLEPSDFGIFALVTMVLTIVQGVTIAPLSEVVVQSEHDDIGDFIFSAQMAVGLVWCVVLFGVAGPLADWVNEPLLRDALRVSLLLLVIMPVTETAIRVSMRTFAFQVVFVRRLVTPLINACVSVPLALWGAGYWALVWGQIAGFIGVGVIVVAIGSWRPRWNLNIARFRKDIGFGAHMMAMGLVKWVRNQSDRAILAPRIDSAALGQYDMARRLAGLPIQVIVDTIAQVLYAVMSDKARRGEDIGQLFLMSQRRLLMIAIPIALTMALNSTHIIVTVLGEKWLGMVPFFQILALAGVWSSLVGSNMEVFKARGQPGVMTRFAIVRAGVTFVTFVILAPYGIMAVVWGVLGLATVFSPVNIFLTLRLLGVGLNDYFGQTLLRPACVAGAVLGVSWVVYTVLGDQAQAAWWAIGLSALVTAAALLIFERDMLKRGR